MWAFLDIVLREIFKNKFRELEFSVLNGDGAEMTKSGATAYKSQYGLQGTVFRHLARYMEKDEIIGNRNLICCLATSFVFAIIIVLIFEKYNILRACCFLFTFWLSP